LKAGSLPDNGQQAERRKIMEMVNSTGFSSSPPGWIVPTWANRGKYLASEPTVYRILKDEKQQHHLGRAKAQHQL
jgi:putative transposase